mmetsp:Transcript_11689/g.19026  ORF Transcript_11689/g.19026 Transcript_11689/m.19026 type:complete len:251 (+) Transcript_11689:44-796(+)
MSASSQETFNLGRKRVLVDDDGNPLDNLRRLSVDRIVSQENDRPDFPSPCTGSSVEYQNSQNELASSSCGSDGECLKYKNKGVSQSLRAAVNVDFGMVEELVKCDSESELFFKLDFECGVIDNVLEIYLDVLKENVSLEEIWVHLGNRMFTGYNRFMCAKLSTLKQACDRNLRQERYLYARIYKQIETITVLREEFRKAAGRHTSVAAELALVEKTQGVDKMRLAKEKVAKEECRIVECLDSFFKGSLFS